MKVPTSDHKTKKILFLRHWVKKLIPNPTNFQYNIILVAAGVTVGEDAG